MDFKVCGKRVTLYVLGFEALVSVLEFLDPAQDSAAAGQSWLLWHGGQVERFKEAWRSSGGFASQYFIEYGLPGVLSGLVAFNCMLNLLSLLGNANVAFRRMRTICNADCDILCAEENWKVLGNLADTGNVELLGFAFSKLARARGMPVGGRQLRTTLKVVLEAVPQLWLQISLLAITYAEQTSSARAMLVFSIVGSMKGIASNLMNECGVGLVMWQHGRAGACLGYTFWAQLSAVMALCCLPRLAGVWYCPSHTFNYLKEGKFEPGCLAMNATASYWN